MMNVPDRAGLSWISFLAEDVMSATITIDVPETIRPRHATFDFKTGIITRPKSPQRRRVKRQFPPHVVNVLFIGEQQFEWDRLQRLLMVSFLDWRLSSK